MVVADGRSRRLATPQTVREAIGGGFATSHSSSPGTYCRTMPTTCALCRRVVHHERLDDPQALQEHHLIPENRAESPTVTLCRPCHKQVHATFTNEELRETYHTVEALREADRLAGYLSWIRSTGKLDIRVRTSDHVRERR